MKCYGYKWLSVFVSLLFLPSIVNGQASGSKDGELPEPTLPDACSNIIKSYYDDLNNYIQSVDERKKKPGADISVPMNDIFGRFGNIDSKCISPDYSYVTDDRRTDLLTIREYLSEIERYVYQSKKIIKYKIIDISDYKTTADTAQMSCSLKINSVIRCKAVFRINGHGKIVSITVDCEDPLIVPAELKLNIAMGYKISNSINCGFGVAGLSDNGFFNRMCFGSEYMAFFNQGDYDHYPTSIDGAPAILTYASKKNGDFGLGGNVGYSCLFGNHHRHHWVTPLLGMGCIVYDCWKELTNASTTEKHRSTAFYCKFSLRWNCNRIGAEAGYCISPKYRQAQGCFIQVVLAIPFSNKD